MPYDFQKKTKIVRQKGGLNKLFWDLFCEFPSAPKLQYPLPHVTYLY